MIFDFNGTLSDDEPVLLQVFTELFEKNLGWQMSAADYYDRLAGHSDREIIETAVAERADPAGDHRKLIEELLGCRRVRYLELVDQECPIREQTRCLVRRLAEEGYPVAIVTGAQRADVDFVLSRSDVGHLFEFVITEEDVRSGKPHPEGFLRAAELLGVRPGDVLVFEDSLAGVRAASAAGMRCVAVLGTHDPGVLAAEGVPTVDVLSPELAALL